MSLSKVHHHLQRAELLKIYQLVQTDHRQLQRAALLRRECLNRAKYELKTK
jgi:hypothetical protein